MSKISFEDFAKQFKDELDIQTVGFEILDLKDIPEYDSIGKIKASLVIESAFGFEIKIEVLSVEKNLHSLWHYCEQNSKS